jgi:hypothetical protein
VNEVGFVGKRLHRSLYQQSEADIECVAAMINVGLSVSKSILTRANKKNQSL